MNGASGNALFMSPQDAELENFEGDYTPDLDFLDGEANFDFDNADLGGDMIGSLPGSGEYGTEQHEKRKNPDGDDFDDGDVKRQETQKGERGAKKPGRKPLTSEPTTKRKAQNRAAQRAFRERKEAHLKDLETKVTELTRSQEADKHENGMLKAQVDKLQVELREYRKRLSLNGGSGISRSPPSSTYGTVSRSNSGQKQAAGNFQFDFPKFGATQASNNAHIYGNGVIKRDSGTPPLLPSHPHSQSSSFSGPSPAPAPISRQQSSGGRSMSPASLYGVNSGVATPVTAQGPDPVFATYSTTDNMHGFASTLPQMMNDPFGDLFSPSILKSSNHDATNSYFADVLPQQGKAVPTLPHDASNGGESTAGLNRVFQFNSGSSASDSASPSASSTSQWNANGANSSCGTSPEPSHDSPASGTDKHTGLYMDNTGAQAYSQYANFSQQPSISSNLSNSLTNDNSVFTPSTTQAFDPVMFGDYRENQDSLGGNGGDFTGGFFDDALNTGAFDFGSPSNLFGILQSPQQINAPLKTPNQNQAPGQAPSRNLLAEIEKTRNGGDDDYGLPVSQPSQPSQPAQAQTKDGKKLISCNNIWNQLQSNPDFQSGTFDLDGLCSELRAKARCSESGVMVDQDHVDAALRKLGNKEPVAGMPSLMFEQDSWDNLMKKVAAKQ